MGDAPYAATFHTDAHDQAILWVWLRDPPPENIPAMDYSGCLGVPRVVTHLSGSPFVFQSPLPQLQDLRSACVWSSGGGADPMALQVDGLEELPGSFVQDHLDCELALERCALLACD